MNIRQKLNERLRIYEDRTGDFLVFNAIAKVSEVTGLLAMGKLFAENSNSTGSAVTAVAFMAGGILVDKLTGGLRPYEIHDEGLNNR